MVCILIERYLCIENASVIDGIIPFDAIINDFSDRLISYSVLKKGVQCPD
jgi:hypothetical protein